MLDQPVIKLVLLVSVVVVTAMLTRSTAGVRHQAVRRLLLVGFVVLAAIAILFPRVMTQVAQLLGVGRGADLLLYGLTVVFLGYVAASYRRMRQLEQQVTTLARELALRAAVHDTTEHDGSGHVGNGHETGYDESAPEDPAPDGGQTSRRSQS